MHSVVHQLYSTTSARYHKFKGRLDKAVRNGRFYKLTKKKQSVLISRLKRLYQRLQTLQLQLKLAGATAAFSFLASASSAQTLGPFNQNDAANPLPPPYKISEPRVAVVDIDGDGDLDIFGGDFNGDIHFFRNNNGQGLLGNVKRFTEVTGAGNPFDGVNKGSNAAPAFADIDGDGDHDMLLGIGSGYTYFFRNNSGIFTEEIGISNPFNGIRGSLISFSSKYGPAIPVFVDLDGDSDLDLFIGSTYLYDISSPQDAVKFYRNNAGVFTETSEVLSDYLSGFSKADFTFADIDNDGDLDVLASNGNGSLRSFFKNGASLSEQFGVWNPLTRAGNPMHNFYFRNGSPEFADFDGDGDLDLIVGDADSYGISVSYFENTDGAFSFKVKDDLNVSPMGGVDVGNEASPQFVDLDGDGDLDAILGSKYNYSLNPEIFVYLRDEDGDFVPEPNHPIIPVLNAVGYVKDIIPIVADIDNDGDNDFIICANDRVLFLKNNDGTFVNQPSLFPAFNSGNGSELSLALIDMDNDNDLDALFGNENTPARIEYFENQANPSSPTEIQVPNFISATPPAPFNALTFGSNPNPNVTAIDVDNDGDRDIVLTETYYFQSGYNGDRAKIRFFENNNDGSFTEGTTPIDDQFSALPYINFADIDGDGDLDGFIGTGNLYYTGGRVLYFENTNPPPIATVPTTTLIVNGGTATLLVSTLGLVDTDGDQISEAIISIANFRLGEEVLSFTPQSGITGSFDTNTGVLTLSGLASVASYQSALRSVTYQFTGPNPTTSGRSVSGRTKAVTLNRSITWRVLDQDLTSPLLNTLSVQILFPDPNQPPVIADNSGVTQIGNSIDLDFTTLITDPDGNLDASSLKVIQPPGSGASYTITGLRIKLDYTGTDFAGPDQFTIEVCDLAGACTQKVVNLLVEGEVVVYNGISPNGDGPNDYFQLKNIVALEPNNKVSIYTRWGDKVFEIENYDNDQRKFVGLNDKGNELTSGVYFYRIEFTSGKKELTGYLTIKR